MLKLNVKKYIVVAMAILLLIFLHYSKILNPVEAFIVYALKPVSGGFYSLGSAVSGIFHNQTDKQLLAGRLAAAENKANQLTAENVKLKFLEEENLILRKQLNFLTDSGARYLMANIVSRGEPAADSSDSRSIIIDKGSRDGLFSGLAVVGSAAYGASSRGVIIGKVVNVKEQMSEIYLVTNKNCKLAASILGESKTSGIARGELGLTVKMDFISQAENIKMGDEVATSGLERNIPRGLVIGHVTRVDRENNEVWQSAAIEPLINLDSLSVVSILLP